VNISARPAMDLTLEADRVRHCADVVHDNVADDLQRRYRGRSRPHRRGSQPDPDVLFLPSYRLVTLSAFSLLSFAGRIAGVASRLPLGFHGGFPRGPLGEFRIARLLLGLQAGLTSGSLGDLRGG
jgi:hypothetical protein